MDVTFYLRKKTADGPVLSSCGPNIMPVLSIEVESNQDEDNVKSAVMLAIRGLWDKSFW